MKKNWVSKLTVVMMASALLAGGTVTAKSASAIILEPTPSTPGAGTSDVLVPADPADVEIFPDATAVIDLSGEQPSDLSPMDGVKFPGVPTNPTPGDVLDGASTTATLTTRDKMVNLAVSKIGSQYVWSATGPTTFDCSGFTMWIYKQFGYSLPHSSSTQSTLGTAVSISNLQKGDLLFYSPDNNGKVGHVAMYIGGGYMVHAANEKTGVVQTAINNSWYKDRFICARHFDIK